MPRLARAVAALTVAGAVAASLASCSSEDAGNDGDGPAATVTTAPATTTSTAPVTGTDGEPVDLPAPVADRWSELGGPDSGPGLPTGPATEVEGGSVTEFEHAMIVLDRDGRAFVVQGEIADAYRDSGGPAGELGFPTSDEATTDGGWISTFENGTIALLDGEVLVEND
ncbi:MAG TPA: hypothetical protein H9759_11245 [Candidatus Dietzia intestinipullorum]|nr:hypothetical protein [Candidatus Dietzia intestinipullorum]